MGYMQVAFGYLFGYLVIAWVLMPLYYRMGLTSIYAYLGERLGDPAYKTGSFYFLISRVLGASFRLYLVAQVLQAFIFDRWNVPFEATVGISIILIWLYTNRGGIRTIIWTDALQTLSMLSAVGLTIILIGKEMGNGPGELITWVANSSYSQIFFFEDWKADNYFFKQFLGGMFISMTMTGMDQDMMQKNLSCRNIWEAQKNMLSFSGVLVIVNLVFVGFGALLYLYAGESGIAVPDDSDLLYPRIAIEGGLGMVVGVAFVLGLIAAAYSSADSALTALTTAFCVDFLNVEEKTKKRGKTIRRSVHVGMSVLLLVVIVIFNHLSDASVIDQLLTVAGYTYGPLLGMFAFGILTPYRVRKAAVPVVCLLAPVVVFFLDQYSAAWFNGYQFGYELLIVNGLLTFLGLLSIKCSEGSDAT